MSDFFHTVGPCSCFIDDKTSVYSTVSFAVFYTIRTVVDFLAPSHQQQPCCLFHDYRHDISHDFSHAITHVMRYIYPANPIKQTMLERSHEVRNALVPLLMAGRFLRQIAANDYTLYDIILH